MITDAGDPNDLIAFILPAARPDELDGERHIITREDGGVCVAQRTSGEHNSLAIRPASQSTQPSSRDSLEKATSNGNTIATSQIALPAGMGEQVYATAGYASSVAALPRVSLETDNVFADDGGVHDLGTISGTDADGLRVELAVGVNG